MDQGEKDMTDVTQMQLTTLVCSFHEAFWMVWWMKQNHAVRLRGSREWLGSLLTGARGGLFLTLVYGIAWYGMRETLSCLPAILFFAISFSLLWESEEKESVLYAAGYLLGLEVTLWFAGRLPQHGLLTGQLVWLGVNLLGNLMLKFVKLREYKLQLLEILGTMGAAFFLTLFFSNFFWDMLRGERIKEYFYLACLTTVLSVAYIYGQKMRMREQLEYLDVQNGLLEQSYRRSYDFYAENAKLYHDMHHHLRAVEQMITRGEDAEALEYIASVQEPVRTAAVPVRTGVELVDTVLYEATEQAETKKIDLQIDAFLFSGMKRLQKKDICALFANLTENALEAAKSRIRIVTRTVPGMLLLEIRNDYREKPEISEGHLQTKKTDSTRHGWGLRIVEQIVRKYEGQIDYEIVEETEEFRVRVWLNL